MNTDKCKFRQGSIIFLGHVIDENGICARPNKVKAVTDMMAPMSISELKRFMSMVNFMSKYVSFSDVKQTIASVCNEQKKLLDTVKTFSGDIKMEFGLDKYAKVTFKERKLTEASSTKLDINAIIKE